MFKLQSRHIGRATEQESAHNKPSFYVNYVKSTQLPSGADVCWTRVRRGWTHQSPRQGIRFKQSRGKFMRHARWPRVLSSGLLISQLGNHAAWSPACFQFDSASPTRHAHARLKQAKQAKKSKLRKKNLYERHRVRFLFCLLAHLQNKKNFTKMENLR